MVYQQKSKCDLVEPSPAACTWGGLLKGHSGGQAKSKLWEVPEPGGREEWGKAWSWVLGGEALTEQGGTPDHPGPGVGATQRSRTWTRAQWQEGGLQLQGRWEPRVRKSPVPAARENLSPKLLVPCLRMDAASLCVCGPVIQTVRGGDTCTAKPGGWDTATSFPLSFLYLGVRNATLGYFVLTCAEPLSSFNSSWCLGKVSPLFFPFLSFVSLICLPCFINTY